MRSSSINEHVYMVCHQVGNKYSIRTCNIVSCHVTLSLNRVHVPDLNDVQPGPVVQLEKEILGLIV